MSTTVTSKGQVTIPKPVRERLGIKPGTRVDFRIEPDGTAILQVESGARPSPSRFEKLRGIAPTRMSTDEILALTRGDPE